MISYDEFKILFDKLEFGTEIEIYFNNNINYMIVKEDKYLTYGKTIGKSIIKYNSLDEIELSKEWKNIKDIIINFSYSAIDDKKELIRKYKIQL